MTSLNNSLTDSAAVAIAQIRCRVGDVMGNATRIVQACEQAAAQGAGLVLFPEQSLAGYPAEDLLARTDFIEANQAACARVVEQSKRWPNLIVVFGLPWRSETGLLNAAAVVQNGRMLALAEKQLLPNYQVFDERRHFVPGRQGALVFFAGFTWGVLICEDVWSAEPAAQLAQQGAQGLLILNASPYAVGKPAKRREAVAQRCQRHGLMAVYCNLVGGQDELVFDGDSFVLNTEGRECLCLPSCEESLTLWRLDSTPSPEVLPTSYARVKQSLAVTAGVDDAEGGADSAILAARCAELYRVLSLGLHDYVTANRFRGVVLGLSGGVDSALVLMLACDALGSARVKTVMMPSRYTSEISLHDAQELAQRMGVEHQVLSIEPSYQALLDTLAPAFAGRAQDLAEENLQARVRGVLLMALSNKFGDLVLATGNKSELTTGYCTLYGDMAGGFAPIKDLGKVWVYRLAHWRNEQARARGGEDVIPSRILTRAPSAELRDNQTDQDSLPEYEVIDRIISGYVEHDQPFEALVQQGLPRAAVEQVIRLLHTNEYKRRQGPPGTRVTERAFGRDWRYPISSGWRGYPQD